jgi:hypothetical protein
MTLQRMQVEGRSALNVQVDTETKRLAMHLRDVTGWSLPVLTAKAWRLLEAHLSKQAEA